MKDAQKKVWSSTSSPAARMPDRHWSDGLHQTVEAKEGVSITVVAEHSAQITFQSYFRLYQKLAGMSGTAAQNRRELRRFPGYRESSDP